MALQLSTQSFSSIPLAASPAGSTPSNVAFAITSSGGPFSILGFYCNAAKLTGALAGQVQIELSRINGNGVIHPALQMAEGNSVRPQDLVIAYGAQLSSSHSLSFQVTQFPSASGLDAPFHIEGTIVFLAEQTVTLAVAVTEP
jgi:hypothetical protein